MLQHAHNPVHWYPWGDEALEDVEIAADDRHRAAAERLPAGFGPAIGGEPTAHPEMLLALDFWLDGPKEIVIASFTPGSCR